MLCQRDVVEMQEGTIHVHTFLHEHTSLVCYTVDCSNTTGLVYFVSVLHNLNVISFTKALLELLDYLCVMIALAHVMILAAACLGGELKIFKIRKFRSHILTSPLRPTAVGCFIDRVGQG